jgi:Restriction endonuclease BglII
MKIIDVYEHFNAVSRLHQPYLDEVYNVIASINALKIKISKEKTRLGRPFYSPISMNQDFKEAFNKANWMAQKHDGEEIDFTKSVIGVEVQFGKYPFIHNDFYHFDVFARQGLINVGIEILPAKSLQREMSSGVGCFDNGVKFCKGRPPHSPILILGIAP